MHESEPESLYEGLNRLTKSKNAELAAVVDDLEKGNKSAPTPFEKLQAVNKKQHEEYLKFANSRDRGKANAEAFFAYGHRFLQIIFLVVVVTASAAYIAVLLQL